jgi:hypothetical protein
MPSSVRHDDLDRPVFGAGTSATYAERRRALVGFFAHREADGYLPRTGLVEAAARLARGRPADTVTPILDRVLDERAGGDMFWMYPMVLVERLGREALPAEARGRLRDAWRTYRPYRGDTENHWALYYASLYLAAEGHPGAGGDAWFNGRSSAENRREARTYLLRWIGRTAREGQGEFDSPHYLAFYVAPLALLAGFAGDTGLATRARMLLDLLLAELAAESLDGLYAGAFSRIYPGPTFERWKNASTSLAWLAFGTAAFRPHRDNVILDAPGYRPHAASLVMALSGYEPPAVLQEMARGRERPYVHREKKRTRDRIRYSPVRSAGVYKTTYVRDEYALGSMQGGLLQPVQQHTWELIWRTGEARPENNVLFALHPHASARELGMYFPEEPRLLTEHVVKSKGTYDKPGKWTGASPHEQVVQKKDALVALYDIPAGTDYERVSGYFSKRLEGLEEPAEGRAGQPGWLFARGGDALIAYYPLARYEWRREEGRGWRLHSPHRRNGAVVQVAPASAYPSLAAFAEAVRALPLEAETEPAVRVAFTSLRGDRIEATYGERPVVNGAPLDYEAWPLYDGPYLQAEAGTGVVDLTAGGRRRRLDFAAGTFTTTTTDPS